jgi:hypothetical protein
MQPQKHGGENTDVVKKQPPEQPEFGLIHSDDSDLALPKKRKGASSARKVIGWVLFLGLLVVFAVVMEHRI